MRRHEEHGGPLLLREAPSEKMGSCVVVGRGHIKLGDRERQSQRRQRRGCKKQMIEDANGRRGKIAAADREGEFFGEGCLKKIGRGGNAISTRRNSGNGSTLICA